jgi:hypothetical protein
MSEREADETAKFGEVLRWSTDSEGDEEPITQTLLSTKKSKEKEAFSLKAMWKQVETDF